MEPDSHPGTRDALRRVIVAWLFGAAWMYLVNGAIFTRYAKLLHVSHFGFGVLATVPFAGALAQLPTSLLLERYGHRKQVFIGCALLHRVLWLVIAALPWMVPERWQWPCLLATMLTSTVLANVSSPAWLAWMAELVPGRIRGRYFSRRIQYGQAVGLILSFLSGLALDLPRANEADLLRAIISALFAFAAVCGIVDILLFLNVPDTDRSPRRPALGFRDLVAKPLADSNFRRFLGYSFTMTFAVGFVGQFVWLYLFDEVGMSNSRANLLLVSVPLIVGMATYPIWGRIVDRFGSKPTLIVAGLLVVNGATAWIFITRDTLLPGYLASLVATVAWGGMDIAAFNLLLRMSDDAGRRSSNTAVIAINSVVVAIAGTLSGLFGGSIAEALGSEWRTTILGWTLTYHGVLFILSAVLRAAAVGWLFSLRETRGKVATREALRYMATTACSSILQATSFPARVMIRLARSTWKLPKRDR